MGTRLKDKTSIIVRAGQIPGNSIGNGRAISVLFAREGARVFLVDRDLDSAKETKAMIEKEGGQKPFRQISQEKQTIEPLLMRVWSSLAVLIFW